MSRTNPKHRHHAPFPSPSPSPSPGRHWLWRWLMAVIALASLATSLAFAANPQVSQRYTHTLALRSDGAVFAWGSDGFGQMGLDREVAITTPRQVAGLPLIAKAVGGNFHVLALGRDGLVYAWGDSLFAQIGERNVFENWRPGRISGLDFVQDIAAGSSLSAALRRDGTVRIWGTNPIDNSPIPIPVDIGLRNVRSIAVGNSHLVVMDANGRVITAGSNESGQLGIGNTNSTSSFWLPNISSPAAIAAGPTTTAVLTTAGRLFWWGQLGAPLGSAAVTVPRELTGLPATVTEVAMSPRYGYARLTNGQVWRWDGAGQVSQVGGYTDANAIATLKFSSSFDTVGALGAGGQLRTTGHNGAGQLAIGNTNTTGGIQSPAGQVFAQISAGGQFFTGVKADGSLWFWGANINGEAGAATLVNHPVPRRVPNLPANIVEVAASEASSFALDSSGQVWAWGDNEFGILGNGGYGRTSRPTRIPNLTNVTQIVAGNAFAAFRRSDGTVWSVGASFSGTSPTPYQITGVPSVRSLAAGGFSFYMLTEAGELYGWGNNGAGQLGDGTQVDRGTPVKVNIPAASGRVTAVAGGAYHAMAATADRGVYTWGLNSWGQTGDSISSAPSNDFYTRPTAYYRPGSTAVPTRLAAGVETSFILYGDGEVHVAGRNNAGQLGAVDSVNYRDSFVSNANLAGATTLSAGFLVGFATAPDGTLLGWGLNARSALAETVGDGTYSIRYEPSIVRAQDGSGTLEGANWFLDLDLAQANVIQPIRIPGLLTVSQLYGGNAAASLEAVIQYRQRDQGKNVGNFAIGLVPREFLDIVNSERSPQERADAFAKAHQQVEKRKAAAKARSKAGGPDRLLAAITADSDLVLVQLTPTGWQVVTGQLTALTTNVVQGNSTAQRILNNINLNLIPGAQFCVGYGTDANAMLSESNLSEVLAVPGAASTSGGLPCLRSGAYLQGPEKSRAGETVRFNVMVVGIAPTGNVSLRNNTTALRTLPLPTTGNQAVRSLSFDVTGLALGRSVISAAYAGDGANNPAATSASLNHDVQAAPTLAVTGPATSTLGQSVTFTATLAGGSNPGGTLTFFDGGLPISNPLNVVNARASVTVNSLIAGGHTITAAYSGDTANTSVTSLGLAHAVTAPNLDTTPDGFTFTNVTQVERNAVITSSPVTIRGMNAPTTVTVTGGEFSVGCTLDFTAGASTTFEGQSICVRHTSSSAGSATTTTTLTVGGVTASFTSTTAAIVIDPSLPPNEDFDNDGIPNGVEATVGTNPRARDNDVFGNPRLFAMQQFRDFLGREGDTAGVDFWSGQLSAGARTRAQMVEDYFGSAEFQQGVSPVVRLYFAYFNRIPDSSGLLFWIGQAKQGSSLETISNSFAASGEFVATYGNLSNSDFVNRVYQNVLGRPADAGGLQFWAGQLNSGATTRGRMMAQFSESAEYRAAKDSDTYVVSIYVGMLRRSPDPGGFAFWAGERRAGRSGIGLIQGFLDSGEYRGRFL
jgi:alpha-tubulin suppressor-like RCC1 family protein